MFRLLTLTLIFLLCEFSYAHNNIKNEGDIQSELMPQELNPSFVSEKDAPWYVRMPTGRYRRESDNSPGESNTEIMDVPTGIQEKSLMNEIKHYSRIIAGVVIIVTAVIELALFIYETYYKS